MRYPDGLPAAVVAAAHRPRAPGRESVTIMRRRSSPRFVFLHRVMKGVLFVAAFAGIVLVLLRADAGAQVPPPRALDPGRLADWLRSAGIDPADVAVDPIALRLAARPRFDAPAAVDAARHAPLRARRLLASLALQGVEAAHDPGELIAAAARMQNCAWIDRSAGVRLAPPAGPDPDALYDAVAGFYDDGRRLDGNRRDALRRAVQSVPEPVGRAAARLIRAIQIAEERRRSAFHGVALGRERIGAGGVSARARAWLEASGAEEGVPAGFEAIAAGADFTGLYQGAADLARALGESGGYSVDGAPFAFDWDAPGGRISIRRGGDDRYDGPHLLIMDFDGNDLYHGAGSASPSAPIAVILDLEGSDRYEPADSTEVGPAGAIAGYALIDDRFGEDRYRAGRLGLGAGLFGVGLLLDRAGADTLEAEQFAEGAGCFGIGILADLRGDDVYRVAAHGQGCAGPGGVGWLIDLAGDDAYRAAGADSVSRAQGCAFGRSGDVASPRVWPGGVGILVDAAGADSYDVKTFGQGAARDAGLGLLVDLAGEDRFRAVSHAQGWGEDLGVGTLIDRSGHDAYTCSGGDGLGAAARLGFGLCVDEEGDDRYLLGRSGLGAAGPGMALFLDGGGDDLYDAGDPHTAFGAAAPPCACEPVLVREWFRVALFLDAGGRDAYPPPHATEAPGEGRSWRPARLESEAGNAFGVGIDRP